MSLSRTACLQRDDDAIETFCCFSAVEYRLLVVGKLSLVTQTFRRGLSQPFRLAPQTFRLGVLEGWRERVVDKGAQQMEAPPPPQPTGALVQTTLSFGRTMHVHRPASVASSSATPLSSVSMLNVNPDSPGAQGGTSVSVRVHGVLHLVFGGGVRATWAEQPVAGPAITGTGGISS